MQLLETLITLRLLSHLAHFAKEFSRFSKGNGTDVHTQTLKLLYKTGLSYRWQRNLFGVLAVVVMLVIGEDFQQEFCPAVLSLHVSLSDLHWRVIERGLGCATGLIIWDNENKGDCRWLNASFNRYIKKLSWCQRSTQTLCAKSSWGTLQLLTSAVHSSTFLLLKKESRLPGPFK